jgi:hemolysin III
MAWLSSPRYLIVPLYIALGWVAVFVLPEILHRAGVASFVLLLTGGALYSLGALVYATRRPDPSPRVFGYHEVFHAFTLVAAVCHYLAVMFILF